jgi:deoxyribose-phosphate aldolase
MKDPDALMRISSDQYLELIDKSRREGFETAVALMKSTLAERVEIIHSGGVTHKQWAKWLDEQKSRFFRE